MRVATALGRSVRSVSRDSYALTLWTFWQIEEVERLARITRERERLDLAGLVALAYHDPKKLADAEHRFRLSIGAVPSREEAIERARTLLRKHPRPTLELM